MKETKNVPQLRFSGFDDEWEEKKLGDTICEVNERTSDFNKNPLFSLTIENGITEKTERYERSQLVTKDDDLFKIMHPQNFATNPMNLRFGAVGYSKEKQDISVSGYYDVFSIDNNECSDFWYSYFKTDKILKKFDDAATGSLIEKRRVHFSVLKQLVFLQPNYKEKQKIGAFLSHVDSLIQAKTKKLESLKAVKKSLLQKCFPKAGEKVPEMRFAGFSGDWEENTIGEIAEIITGGTPSTLHEDYWFPKEIPWLSSGEVNKKYVTFTDDFISKKGFNNSSAHWIKENSVLIALAGQGKTRGTVAINMIPLTTNQSIAGIILNNEMDTNFVFQSLERKYDAIRKMSSGDGSRGGLNKQLVSEITFMCPPKLEEQQKIGQFFSKYDSLISAQQKEIDKLKDIKKSLLQKMFI